jgi:UDP-GlcNAc3NAcA epimerase
MVLPVHPRTRELAPELGFEFDGIRAIEPLVFLQFLQPAKGLALTDSGGGPGGDVHSGSSGVTLRGNTERPEIGECGCECACRVSSIEMLKATRQVIHIGLYSAII